VEVVVADQVMDLKQDLVVMLLVQVAQTMLVVDMARVLVIILSLMAMHLLELMVPVEEVALEMVRAQQILQKVDLVLF
jgi:diacylglycerol kinase